MFHWICPECGREIPPAMKECPACDASAGAARPALSEAVSESSLAPVTSAQTAQAGGPPALPAPQAHTAAAVMEPKESIDPLKAAAEQLRSLQAQAANGRSDAKAKARHEEEARREAEARHEAALRAEAEAKIAAEAALARAKEEEEAAAKLKAEQEAQAKREAEAKLAEEKLVEEKLRAEEAARAQREAELKAAAAEAEAARAKAEEEAKRELQAKLEAAAREAAAKLEAEAQAAAAAKAAAKAEQKARREAEARAEAEAKARAEEAKAAEARAEEAKAEEEARQASARHEAEAARAKAEEETRAEREPEAKAEAEAKAEGEAEAQAKAQTGPQETPEAVAADIANHEQAGPVEASGAETKPASAPPPLPPSLSGPMPPSAPAAGEANGEAMERDLAALASINPSSNGPTPGEVPDQAAAQASAPGSQPPPPGTPQSSAAATPSSSVEASAIHASESAQGRMLAAPVATALLTPPELETEPQPHQTESEPDLKVPGLAKLVDSPKSAPVMGQRTARLSDPASPLTEREAQPAIGLISKIQEPGLPEPAFSLAGRQGHTSTVASRIKPMTIKHTVRTSDSIPQFVLPGPSIPPQLESVSDAGLTAASIGKGGFASTKKKTPKAPPAAGPAGSTSSVKGWLVSLSVMTVMLAIGGGIIYWALPSQTLASVRNSGAKSEPPASTPEQTAQETPAAPTNSLSKQIEVTGFRFVSLPNKKAEIHYLVVNHSQLALNDVTVYVTLHANNAKPGQPPLSRFSFRAPNVAPNESREMSSTIEKVTQPISLPEWQDVRAEISIGQ